MFDLSGMTALVTGASGGLGSAIARALAGQGARLAISGSNVEKLEAFRAGLGGDHVALPCNLSDGVAVDQLAPGFETSAKTDALNEQQRESILSRIPVGAMGGGDDLGAACVFLASREAGYVTGQTLHVNGGMAML